MNNHAFIDGNKRIGHAATETFLILNGSEIDALSTNKNGWCSISHPVG